VTRRRFPVGANLTPANAPAGGSRSSYGGDEIVKAFGRRVTKYGDSASVQAVTRVNAEQASKTRCAGRPDLPVGIRPILNFGIVVAFVVAGERLN